MQCVARMLIFRLFLTCVSFLFGQKEAKKLIDEFEASWTPIEWTVTEVYMISRQGFDAPFEV